MPFAGTVVSSLGSQTSRSTPVSRAATLAISANSLSTQSSFAPECLRMKCASAALSMKLIGTRTPPTRARAKRSAANACELRAMMATRSPGPTPVAARPAARRLHTSSNSAYVQTVAPQRMAVFCGKRFRVRRSRSPRVCRRSAESMPPPRMLQGMLILHTILNSILPVKRWYAARREQRHRTRASESHGAGARAPAGADRHGRTVAGRADPAAGDGRPARLQPGAAARGAERPRRPGAIAAPAAPGLLRRQTRAERAGADSPHAAAARGRAPGLDGVAEPGGPEGAEEAQSGDAQARRRGGVDPAHAQEPRFPLQDLLPLAPPRHPRRGAPVVGPRRALYRSTDVLARGASAHRRRARRDPPHAGEAGSQAPRLGDGEAPGVDLHRPAARALAVISR